MLMKLVQELYYSGNTSPMVELVLQKEDLGDFFAYGDSLVSTQERLEGVMSEMKALQEKLGAEKKSLEEAKANHESALAIQNRQKQNLAFQQAETAEDLEDQAATLSELQSKLQELRSDLSVLTGKSFNAKDIREAVEFASDETGVPKGVLYGFLKMETNLGVNTGQCTYDQVKKDALSRYYNKNKSKYKNSIALLEKRHDIFKDIVDELGYSKNKKVSCTPRSYVGQGGAMGVAQFMSDTWRGYEGDIRSKTGSKEPDPWDLADGVMGLALKVRKAGGTSDSSSAIRKASINYLGAFNTNYYNGIVYWSKNYKKLFN
jgi:membrane-bound lytic murein transglycosylase B